MTKYTTALATPSVEMKIEVRDATGKSIILPVGFKRYTIEEGKKLYQELDKVRKPLKELLNRIKNDEDVSDELFSEISTDVAQAENFFFKKEILYVKNFQLFIGEEKGPLIVDTRTDTSRVWEEELNGEGEKLFKTCLDFVLEIIFSLPNYRSAIIEGFHYAVSNTEKAKEAGRKNS